MEKGWDARVPLGELLKARKKRGEPYTQQWLAEQTGIQRTTINGYLSKDPKNENRPRLTLGLANGRRIAEILEVTVQEIGGPDEEGLTLGDRLRELADGNAEILAGQRALLRHFRIELAPPDALRSQI